MNIHEIVTLFEQVHATMVSCTFIGNGIKHGRILFAQLFLYHNYIDVMFSNVECKIKNYRTLEKSYVSRRKRPKSRSLFV